MNSCNKGLYFPTIAVYTLGRLRAQWQLRTWSWCFHRHYDAKDLKDSWIVTNIQSMLEGWRSCSLMLVEVRESDNTGWFCWNLFIILPDPLSSWIYFLVREARIKKQYNDNKHNLEDDFFLWKFKSSEKHCSKFTYLPKNYQPPLTHWTNKVLSPLFQSD